MFDVEIKIDQLMPDFKNPRIGNANTRLEALSRVVELQGEKIANLARSIVDNGLSPIERMFLIEDDSFPDHYVVVEGNRRATALILLNNPNLMKSMDIFKENTDLGRVAKRLEGLAERFSRDNVEPIRAVLAPDRASTRLWIEFRHTPQPGGEGITRWNAIEAARFADAESRMVVAADFLHEHGELSDVEKELLDEVPWTTIDRFLESPRTRRLLGLGYENGSLIALVTKEEIAKGLRAVAFKVAAGEFDSRKQNSVDDRVGALEALPAANMPDLSKTIEPTKLSELTGKERVEKPATKPKKKKAAPDPKGRDKLFKKTDLAVRENRALGIYHELCTLSVKRTPNASGVLLRVFLEMSVVGYLEAAGVGIQGKGGQQAELHILIERAYKKMKETDPKLTLGPIDKIIEARTTKGRMRVLHEYVHDRHVFPSHSDLVAMTDELAPFFEQLWKTDDA